MPNRSMSFLIPLALVVACSGDGRIERFRAQIADTLEPAGVPAEQIECTQDQFAAVIQDLIDAGRLGSDSSIRADFRSVELQQIMIGCGVDDDVVEQLAADFDPNA